MSPLAGAAQQDTTGRAPTPRLVSDIRAGSVGVRQTDGVAPSAPSVVFLELPLPPSTNNLFGNKRGGGRTKSKAYEEWQRHARWRLREQRPAMVSGPVLVLINVERSNFQADVDNRIKALLDLLKGEKDGEERRNAVIEDDRLVTGLAIAWAPPGTNVVRLAVMPAEPLTIEFQPASPGHGGWFMSAPQQQLEAV